MTKTLMHLMIVAGMLTSAGAQAIVIDGKLFDWGVQQNKGAAGWIPTDNNGITKNSNIQFTIEDWDQSTKNGFLDPGYGGQAYDAEALYALIEGNTLFIALATGHNPGTLTSGNNYGAGDFAIDFGRNGTYELGINVKRGGDTFGEHGGVYKVEKWDYGLWNDDSSLDYVKSQHPTSILVGEEIGTANLVISSEQTGYEQWRTGYGQWSEDVHYFYEMSVSLSLLTDAGWNGKDAFNIHWTQNCANDSIIVDPPAGVPEPGTLALLPLGLLSLLALRRRKLASAA
jgi:hypothetical protein